MTDPSTGLGNGGSPPHRPDPGARRAQLDALREKSSTSGAGFAASPRRRHHAALASRVLATGLAAGTAVGLIGVLAQADQASANATPTTTVAPTLATTTTSTVLATTTLPATTAPPTTAVPATPVPQQPQPQQQTQPQPQATPCHPTGRPNRG